MPIIDGNLLKRLAAELTTVVAHTRTKANGPPPTGNVWMVGGAGSTMTMRSDGFAMEGAIAETAGPR